MNLTLRKLLTCFECTEFMCSRRSARPHFWSNLSGHPPLCRPRFRLTIYKPLSAPHTRFVHADLSALSVRDSCRLRTSTLPSPCNTKKTNPIASFVRIIHSLYSAKCLLARPKAICSPRSLGPAVLAPRSADCSYERRGILWTATAESSQRKLTHMDTICKVIFARRIPNRLQEARKGGDIQRSTPVTLITTIAAKGKDTAPS